jgi:hypothetical protein
MTSGGHLCGNLRWGERARRRGGTHPATLAYTRRSPTSGQGRARGGRFGAMAAARLTATNRAKPPIRISIILTPSAKTAQGRHLFRGVRGGSEVLRATGGRARGGGTKSRPGRRPVWQVAAKQRPLQPDACVRLALLFFRRAHEP